MVTVGVARNVAQLNLELFLIHVEMATRRKSGKPIVTSISSLAKGFVEHEKNSNNIVDIIKYLQVSCKFLCVRKFIMKNYLHLCY